jgi:chromosome segregation ATPase
VLKQNVKGMRSELDEVKRAYDKILAQAHEKQAEVERLDADIKKKREDQANLSNWLGTRKTNSLR